MKSKPLHLFLTLATALFLLISPATGQIYEPEGLNMPGSWDGWTNPPENPVFAGEAQTSGGQVELISLGNPIYQTKIHVASNGDVQAGDYIFKFTSGPQDDIWRNQWGNVSITFNTIQEYTYGTPSGEEPDPNEITLTDNKWYVANWNNIGYENTTAIFMELSGEPVEIASVSHDPAMPSPGEVVTVTIETSSGPNPEENIFLRYSTDSWSSSEMSQFGFTGNTGTAQIPAYDDGTTVSYYVFSSVMESFDNNHDLLTIDYDNNNGSNYEYTIGDTLECGSDVALITTEPAFPLDTSEVVITFNAELGNGGLAGYNDTVYAHTGVITSESTSGSDWKYVKSDWGENTPDTKLTLIDSNLYQLYIPGVRDYYGVPEGEDILEMAFVFRSHEPVNGDQYLEGKTAENEDIFIDVYENELNVKITYPTNRNPLVDPNSLIPVCIASLQADSTRLSIDGEQVAAEPGNGLFHALNTGDYSAGTHWLVASATAGGEIVKDSVMIYLRSEVPEASLPGDVVNGINYNNDESVTLVLHDPAGKKEFAFVIGDFNNWQVGDEAYMNRTPDGNHFWVTIDGLEPGKEYAFQYYIDGELKIADPYTEKILDPYHDKWIPEENYPDLKEYPYDKTTRIVSVLQTAQAEFDWEVEDFTPAAINEAQSDLIVYELLIRDFVDDRRIASVTDSLDYLKDLGVNAIELMPFNEFEGNDSWGYNPSFYFAPDKAYGTEEAYKTFIDECHKRGIAVIMDMVLNHSFSQSPLAQMYWNDELQRPSADNPWYNETSPHPLGIGSDFNHESEYTREFSKRIMSFWMNEYKIDGFRFDLSKGFTQKYTGGDLGAWADYDQSRVDIWNEYYSHMKAVNPNAYVILEHFADNDEEVTLADNGMLLWGNMNEDFNQNTMGYGENSDYSWAYYTDRGFNYPNLIPFMESHDEERLMYRNLTYGNSSGSYDITELSTALERIEAIVPMYYAVPGPKMIWQFGELGYDYSINHCPDGSVSEDCRTSAKPVRWDYWDDLKRQEVYQVYAAMADLKVEAEAFQAGSFTRDLSGLMKRAWVSHSSMNAVIGANFELSETTTTPGFQHSGTWYNYFTGESFEVTDAGGHTVTLDPGGYYVYTDQELERPFVYLTFSVVEKGTGTGIEDATVDLGRFGSRTTNSNGEAVFALSSNQTYDYNISTPQQESASGSIAIEEDDTEKVIEIGGSSVEDVDIHEFVKIFPNPVKQKVNLEIKEDFTVRLYDVDGSVRMQKKLRRGSHTIEVNDLPAGVYFIEFSNEQRMFNTKVVIARSW